MPLHIIGSEQSIRFTKVEIENMLDIGLDLRHVKNKDQLFQAELDFIEQLDMTLAGQQMMIKLADHIEPGSLAGQETSEVAND